MHQSKTEIIPIKSAIKGFKTEISHQNSNLSPIPAQILANTRKFVPKNDTFRKLRPIKTIN